MSKDDVLLILASFTVAPLMMYAMIQVIKTIPRWLNDITEAQTERSLNRASEQLERNRNAKFV